MGRRIDITITKVYRDPVDDQQICQPGITRAKQLLDWEPRANLEEGLTRTIAWFQRKAAARRK